MLLQSIVTQGWRRIVQAAMGLGVAATLAACGGGGGSAGTSVFPGNGSGGGTTTPTAADLTVQLSKATLSTTGSDSLTVTVTAVDTNRNVVGKVPVTFAVDSNAVVAPAGTATGDTTGTLTATVQTGADTSKRTINLTVTAGSVTRKASIDVVDSVTGGKVSDIVVQSASSTIANDDTTGVKITVTTLDANRVAVGGAPVELRVESSSANEDAFVSTGNLTTTNTGTGQLVGTLTLGTNRANRAITVTAKSGTITRSIIVNVITPTVTVPKAADITMLLDKLTVGNSGSEVVTATVTAVNAQRNTIAGIPVAIQVDNNATVQVVNSLTDVNGQVTAKVQIGADKANRLVTVTATSDSLVRTATFQVTGTSILATASPASPDAGSTGNRIEYRVVDVNQNPLVGVPISLSAPGVASATGTTNANGSYVFTYQAPATPGAVDFTATAAGKTSVLNLVVKGGTSTTPNAVGPVVSAAITSAPSVVRVNTATDKSNRTELRALFLAAGNAPVKNVRARFDLNGDVNSIGGTIGADTSLVYSDSNGVAVTNYTPGERASPTDGVTVRVCWDYADFPVGTCPNQKLTTLTVVSDPLSISIGTDNTISEGAAKLTYIKRYVVLVVDAAGNPKSDVQLSASIDLTNYIKGYYLWDAGARKWIPGYQQEAGDTPTTPLSSSISAPGTLFRYGDSFPRPTCTNEDVNRNGSIDGAEDINGNGQLDPRKSDVSIALSGSTKTDTSGTAVIQIEYPKSLGSWVTFRLAVSAAGVLSPPAYYPAPGSDAELPVLAEAITSETPPPPFQSSPYGQRRFATISACTSSK